MKRLLLLPLLLGFSVPVVAHNEANGGQAAAQHNNHSDIGVYLDNKDTTEPTSPIEMEEGEGGECIPRGEGNNC